jgi:integrase
VALTDTAIRKAKPAEREYKLADSGGLYLLVTPAGGRLWRFKYRVHGARKARDAARSSGSAGNDPAADKRRERIAKKIAIGTTFADVSAEYLDKATREGRAPATLNKLRWARDWLLPAVGQRPVSEIEPHELLAVLKRQERSGNLETARRTRAFASRVFRYAVATARAKNDPAALLLGAVAAPQAKSFAAILDPRRLGDLLRAIDAYSGQPVTRLALALSPHVFVRPGELRQAEWTELDLDAAVWRIPAARMKKRREHIVPLSPRSVALFREAAVHRTDGRYVFPAMGKRGLPLSENTATQALRRMGFTAAEMTAHGFRSTASTLLNESGKWSPDAIERALAHRDSDQIRAIYHRGEHWAERVAMAQWWSDYLDALRTTAPGTKPPHPDRT